MKSSRSFSKKEEIKLKEIDFSEIQRVISEVRSYLPKQEIYESQEVEFDDGQGISFKTNLKEVITEYAKKGLNPKRISSNLAYSDPKGGTRITLLTIWLDHANLEVNIGVQSGTDIDVDWARSKADSLKSLLQPLAADSIKQTTKKSSPPVATKKEPVQMNNERINWNLIIAALTLAILIIAYLTYRKTSVK